MTTSIRLQKISAILLLAATSTSAQARPSAFCVEIGKQSEAYVRNIDRSEQSRKDNDLISNRDDNPYTTFNRLACYSGTLKYGEVKAKTLWACRCGKDEKIDGTKEIEAERRRAAEADAKSRTDEAEASGRILECLKRIKSALDRGIVTKDELKTSYGLVTKENSCTVAEKIDRQQRVAECIATVKALLPAAINSGSVSKADIPEKFTSENVCGFADKLR